MVKTVTDFAGQNGIKDFLIREIHISEDLKYLGSMFTMEPLSVKKVRDFFALQKRHIFCKNKFSQKISLRSSKSLIKLINQFFSRF